MQDRRVLAIDPSLTCSGWALFGLKTERILGVGKIRSLPPAIPLVKRLADLQDKIEALFVSISLSEADLLICEAPTTMRDPRAAFKVEQVRGIFETLARARKVENPGRINPRSIHHEVLGLKGKQLPRTEVKHVAVSVVKQLFTPGLQALGFECSPKNLKRHQDIVDALLIGYLGVRWLQGAQWSGSPLHAAFEPRSTRRFSVNR